MSVLGLGRVKTLYRRVAIGPAATRIGRGGAEQTEPMMMMSASLGTGGAAELGGGVRQLR